MVKIKNTAHWSLFYSPRIVLQAILVIYNAKFCCLRIKVTGHNKAKEIYSSLSFFLSSSLIADPCVLFYHQMIDY